MHSSTTCILCGVSGPTELISKTIRDDVTGYHSVMRCLTCGHVQLYPLPSEKQEDVFYASDQQTRNLMGETDFALWKSKAEQDNVRRLNWLFSVLSAGGGGHVLDIGCGYGFFVDLLVKSGYSATGIDVGRDRIDLAREHLEGTFIEGKIDESFVSDHREAFEVVTLFHVLEHIREPAKFLALCAALVAKEGKLLIEVPNFGDELLDQQVDYRAFYWQRAHLSYFDAARLDLVLRRAGFSRSFSVRGVQRYGLRNLLNWLDEGRPQLAAPSFQASEPMLLRLEEIYRSEREKTLRCDTLIAEVQL